MLATLDSFLDRPAVLEQVCWAIANLGESRENRDIIIMFMSFCTTSFRSAKNSAKSLSRRAINSS